MAKIDYSKVERMLQEALHKMHMKQLGEGKPVISSRAQDFYGITSESRPVPEEAVEKLLLEESTKEALHKKEIEEENAKIAQGDFSVLEGSILPELEAPPSSESSIFADEEVDPIKKTPTSESISKARPRKSPPKRPELKVNFDITGDKVQETVSPLYILRQHIFWMKQLHIDKRFELLGTSREQICAWKKKSRLSEDDILQIKALIKKAEHIRSAWEKKLGITSSEKLIEIQQKRHKTKRFNIKDKWIRL